jgi:hypothetical protein
MTRVRRAAASLGMMAAAAVAAVEAQDLIGGTVQTLVYGTTVLQPNPSTTQEELPGMGHKFELLGGMQDDQDPENPTNDTISIDTTGGVIGTAFRHLPPGIKISALNNQLGFKYYFVNRTCGGGSPRLDLFIDSDSDGDFDFTASGHVNPLTSSTGCPANVWVYENMTDELPRWEVLPATRTFPPCGPAGNPATMCTWDQLELRVTANYPDHRVMSGQLLDGESCGFPFLPACGKAYYDLVTIENRTLENDQDTVKDGQSRRCQFGAGDPAGSARRYG